MILVLFLALMAYLAPILTNMGRPYCGPVTYAPLQCGSFWWFIMLIVGLALCIIIPAYLGRNKTKQNNVTHHKN